MSRLVTITASVQIELGTDLPPNQLTQELTELLRIGFRRRLPDQANAIQILAVDDPIGLLSKPFDIKRLLHAQRQVAVIWDIDDVLVVRPELSDEQAWRVLAHACKYHDAGIGLNWETMEAAAESLFGAEPSHIETYP